MQQRVVRVFISSTFRDMHAEREELVKRVSPQLRKLCEQRGVTWGEVDLRWGVTDEQKAEGQVLPICLAEIQNCRPYFIGLLGQRYGWVPDEIAPDLVEREPWLAEHRHHSVTELEILHGVLRNPAMADHAYFYFRDPKYLETLPPEKRKDFTAEDPESAEKLRDLKERIRQSGFPVREDYSNPKALGELVRKDLTEVINRLFPEEQRPDPLDRDAAEHEAFAQSRARVYIGREEYFRQLDEHARGDGPPLVILGESGSGKSALLANWAPQYRERHKTEFLLLHVIGATPYSTDWAGMLRRMLGEFNRRLGLNIEIPDKPEALRATFAYALHMAAAVSLRSPSPLPGGGRGEGEPNPPKIPRIILILDALNQLEDRDGAPDLVWLPPVIPPTIRLIVSTLPGRPLEDLTKRGWPTLRVEPLDAVECRRLISEYLAQYTKSLSPDRVERVAAAPQSANPLYLRALLEELRVFGEHERLDERIASYLEAHTIPQLYEKILTRYEEDYERDRPGLVREVMPLLWAARRGLSETELLEMLGANGQSLPRAMWSPLYLAAEPSLASRSGLVGFAHEYFRQAVEDSYLPTEAEQEAAHLRLADYFQVRDLNPRQVDELPWQLAQARSWQRLFDLLADLRFFTAGWRADQFEIKAYWTAIEIRSPLRMVDAYQPILSAPSRDGANIVSLVALLLGDTGHPAEAFMLWGRLVDHYRQAGDLTNLQTSLGNQALILRTRGDLDAAIVLFKEQERLCRETGDLTALSRSLHNRALILRDQGDLDGAMGFFKEHEQICRKTGNTSELWYSLGNQAVIFSVRGDLDRAVSLLKEQERLCRDLGHKKGLSDSLGDQAHILRVRGDYDGASRLLTEQNQICRELGDKEGLTWCLNIFANILYDQGDLSGAMALHKEEEQVCRELSFMQGLALSLGDQAVILRDQGDLHGALALHQEEERIYRKLNDTAGLQKCLGNQAVISTAIDNWDGAFALLKEQERICRELGHKQGLSQSLHGQALVFSARADLDGAMLRLKEEEGLCHELGNKRAMAACLGTQALILQARGDLDGAMTLHKEAERRCRELGNPEGQAISLANQAYLLATKMSRPREALPLAEQAYALAVHHSLAALAAQINPILDAVRAKQGEP